MPRHRHVQITFTATLTKTLTLPKHEADDFTSDMLDKEFDAVLARGWDLENIEEVTRDEVETEPPSP